MEGPTKSLKELKNELAANQSFLQVTEALSALALAIKEPTADQTAVFNKNAQQTLTLRERNTKLESDVKALTARFNPYPAFPVVPPDNPNFDMTTFDVRDLQLLLSSHGTFLQRLSDFFALATAREFSHEALCLRSYTFSRLEESLK